MAEFWASGIGILKSFYKSFATINFDITNYLGISVAQLFTTIYTALRLENS